MVKVLIVDDEPNVRMGLRKMIDWAGNGFEICGEAEDAYEGNRKILKCNPDIVLMDIKMPGKLGTDMIRESRAAGFNGRFIVLSGYSNFEYAKKVMKYGVKSYILKPIDEDELLEAVLNIKKEIERDNRIKGNETLVRKDKLKKLISGEVLEDFNDLEGDETSTLVLINIAEDSKNDLINKHLAHINNIDIINVNQYVATIFKDIKYERIIKTLLSIKEKMNEKSEFFAVVTNEQKTLLNIRNEYKNALNMMKNKFLYLEESVITSGVSVKECVEVENISEYMDKVVSYVEVQDNEKIEEIINLFKTYILQNKYSEERVKSICMNTLLNIRLKLFKDYEIDKNDISGNEDIIHNIYSKKSLKELLNYMNDELISMSKKVYVGSADNNIKRIISYMEKNYYNDIKLETLAEIFNYNSAYLGKLLKNALGENFNTKLDKIRIEKAKSLLINDKLKVYQVCEKVGYKNIDYFHSKFKKYVGTTPLTYKKNNEKKHK